MIADLGLDRPAGRPDHADRPTSWSPRSSGVVKALLGYGARMPKELMLFVKNMVFLDGAIATLAPDLDLFAEIATHLDVLRRDATASASPPTSASTPRQLRARPRPA